MSNITINPTMNVNDSKSLSENNDLKESDPTIVEEINSNSWEEEEIESDSVKASEILLATFILDSREFGINVNHVREAIKYTGEIIELPTSIDIIDGIINLRGSIIPILNLRKRFGLKNIPLNTNSRIALTKCKGRYFGLLFDDINEVIRVKSTHINAIKNKNEDKDMCENGIVSLDQGSRIIQILAPDLLFNKYDLPLISNKISEERQVQVVNKTKCITFMLNGLEYAVAVNSIQEIIKIPEISKRVNIGEYIRGVISLRGALISLVDLRLYLGLKEKAPDSDSRIIILFGEFTCGILVDSIKEVIDFEVSKILKIPRYDQNRLHQAFEGVINLSDHRNIIHLDFQKFFSEEDKKQIIQNIVLHQEETSSEKNQAIQETNQEKTSDSKVYITFKLDDIFAVDILILQEIIGYSNDIVSLPGKKDYIHGILNLRENVIPIINLRKYYNLKPYSHIDETKIIILKEYSSYIGIMVDEIIEIVKVANAQCNRFSKKLFAKTVDQMKGHITDIMKLTNREGEEKTIMVLDTSVLFNEVKES